MQSNPLRTNKDALDSRIDGLYRILQGTINLDTLIPTCLDVAREIEDLGGLKGSEKLLLLQGVLRHAVKDSEKSEEEKATFFSVIDTVIPIAIQAAILATKSPILAHVHSTCIGCWTKTKRS